MKMFVFVFALLGALLASANHNDPAYWRMVRNGVDGKIVLTGADDLGNPVPDANVHVEFSEVKDLNILDARTDSNGICTLRQRTSGNKITILARNRGGRLDPYHADIQPIFYHTKQ